MCRNCGLPIASDNDPLRGVSPGRVEMPSARRSGLSATVGLVMVIGLLLISGTLAVSGGGILSGGGRLGVDGQDEPSADPTTLTAAVDGGRSQTGTENDGGDATPGQITSSFPYTCNAGSIRDNSSARWRINKFVAGARDGFDRVTWEITRRGANAKDATQIDMRFMTPAEAREELGISRVRGERAIVVTFDGPMSIDAGQVLDQLYLKPQGVGALQRIEMFEDEDGTVHTVIGVNGDGCAKMNAPLWKNKKNKKKDARILLDVQVE